MDTSAPTENSEPQVLFRPNKKRKQFRQRAAELGDSTTTLDNSSATVTATTTTASPATTLQALTTLDDDDDQPEGLSVAKALRLRNKTRLKGGVEFRPEHATSDTYDEPLTTTDLVAKDQDPIEAFGVSRRFAPQQALVGEIVNKHMESYIESELARRHAADKAAAEAAFDIAAQQQQQQQQQQQITNSLAADPTTHVRGGPTRQGRLHEVDLGEEARERNVAMTEQARQRLLAGSNDGEEDDKQQRGPKSWRKRRGSEDLKRDEMVEALMRENKLDVYDIQDQEEGSAAEDDEDLPADERIAEKFRREFMDAMAARRRARRRARAPAPPPRPGTKKEEILKGPKLGGSRNARAAMRDILLSQQEAKKKR